VLENLNALVLLLGLLLIGGGLAVRAPWLAAVSIGVVLVCLSVVKYLRPARKG
jgi:hypothetical protein